MNSDLIHDRDISKKVVKINGETIQYLPNYLQNDREIGLLAIQNTSKSIEMLRPELKF